MSKKRRQRHIVIHADALPWNADWIKAASWDHDKLPRNERELTAWLKRYFPDISLEHFKTLPAYKGWLNALAPKPPPET